MIRLAVRCSPAVADQVLAELLQLAPGGVEEERGGELVEYAIYGAAGELPDLGELRAAVGDELVEVAGEEIPDDWADRWRDFHEPILVGGRVLVRPSWLDGGGSAAAVEVVIDPGQAFGTGAHPTTRMCIELLLELADAGEARGSLMDLGTGSAVLAITAAKLGFSPVLAVDHEVAAVEAAAANARANGVEIDVDRRNLRKEASPAARTIVANLTAPLLKEVAARMTMAPARMICSGLLEREADEVAAAFAARGLVEHRRLGDGDWVGLSLGA